MAGPRTSEEKAEFARVARALVQACPSCGRRQIPKRLKTKLQCTNCLTTWAATPTT